MPERALCPNGFLGLRALAPIREIPTHNQRKDLILPSSNSNPHPADFPLGSAESRGAARVILSRQSFFIVDTGTLPIPAESLPTYKELLRDWKDEGDRYTHELRRDNTLCRCAILKDSEEFRRVKAGSVK
jgi:hypothetical protein